MPLAKLVFKPGMVQDSTRYIAEGGWVDGNLVRFRLGSPEKIGGWKQYIPATYVGSARSLHRWNSLYGDRYMGVGTNYKFYVQNSTSLYDITPIRKTTNPLGADPFAPVGGGSSIITVTDTNHGASTGDFVTFSGATGSPDMNKEFQVVRSVDANTYTVDCGAAQAGTTAFGGATVVAKYQIPVGIDSQAAGTGWGIGSWGRGAWGSAYQVQGQSYLRVWSQDNFGEDLLILPNVGGLYIWDSSNGYSNPAVLVSSLPGANQVPVVGNLLMVTDDRHVVLFGANDVGLSTYDPMLVRWSDQEDYLEWEPRTDTTAGSYRLNVGSEIVAAAKGNGETLIWTDQALFSQQFVGPPYTFGFKFITDGVHILSPNAAVMARNTIYWMDSNNFFSYNSSVSPLKCPVLGKVFDDFNFGQHEKVASGLNSEFNEVWWFYPSSSSTECDRYVSYNFLTEEWTTGTLSRTAWLDIASSDGKPVAAGNGKLYVHESGHDDDTVAMTGSFIESADFDLGDGDQFQFISRIIPDITITGGGIVNYKIKTRDYPGASLTQSASQDVYSASDQLHVRCRGRQAAIRIQCDSASTFWRLGATRLDMRPDGER